MTARKSKCADQGCYFVKAGKTAEQPDDSNEVIKCGEVEHQKFIWRGKNNSRSDRYYKWDKEGYKIISNQPSGNIHFHKFIYDCRTARYKRYHAYRMRTRSAYRACQDQKC